MPGESLSDRGMMCCFNRLCISVECVAVMAGSGSWLEEDLYKTCLLSMRYLHCS